MNDARGTRTPSLRIWNPTRCHCAMASRARPGRAGSQLGFSVLARIKKVLFSKKFYLTPEGFEPPALGFGIPRAAIAPWRRGGLGSTSRSCTRPSRKKKKIKIKTKKKKSAPPLGIEPRTCRLTADRSANGALKASTSWTVMCRLRRRANKPAGCAGRARARAIGLVV